MTNTNSNQKIYKRKHRELDDATKQKISQSLKGRSKSFRHCENIANGLRNYWQQVPSKNNDVEPQNEDGTMQNN